MTAASPNPPPPLSAAAEELLDGLELSAGIGGPAPADPLQWLSALLDQRPEVLGDAGSPSQLDALREVMRERGASGGQSHPFTRVEVAAKAGESAEKEGRPIVSTQDVVWAVLALVTERMSARGQAGVEAEASAPALEAGVEEGTGPLPIETAPLPASVAAEEMLEDLLLRLGIKERESESIFRWLDTLLECYPVSVGGEEGERKIQALREWGVGLLASESPTPSFSAQEIRFASAVYAGEQGRPLFTPQDVAIAIVKAAADIRATFEAEPEAVLPEEEPSEPTFEPAEEPDAIWEFEVPADEREAPSVTQVADAKPAIVDPGLERSTPDHHRTRTFRLFVSSTFRDLQAERNALQEITFPRLKDFCARRGARFQAIDLRWGVSEEAAADQQTMNICLGEIERCHQVTPRPNFLVLLGNRYGWLPPPPQIPAHEFERILDRVEVPEERARLELWYRKELNADPPEYRLQPRAGEREEYRDSAVWAAEEEKILATLRRLVGAGGLELPPDRLKIFQASATEQEILAGALEDTEPKDKVFCFFRTIQGHPEDDVGNPAGGAEAFISPDPEARNRLRSLKERLGHRLPESSILKREVEWREGGPELTEDYLAELADWVAESLEQAILRELERPAEDSDPGVVAPETLQQEPALTAEVREHLEFAAERRRFFVGREDILEEIREYILGEDTGPLAVVGEGGTGKSALMAEAAQRAANEGAGAVLVVRFIGATPASSDGRFLLEGLCREIALQYGSDPGEMPTEYQELVPKLVEKFALARPERPLVLMVDSLDQLEDPAVGLTWIPSPLPDHVRLVVSTRPEEVRDRLERRGTSFLDLGPLSREDGGLLLQAWLSSAKPPRRLQPSQTDSVLDAFVEAEGNPLYLKLATEEARRWPAWAAVGGESALDAPTTPLAKGVRGIISDNLLARLAHEDNHGSELVSHAVAYLAASRYGLAEDELIEILSRDPDVYGWFLQGAEHFPQDLVARAEELWFDRKADGGWENPDPTNREAEVIRRLRDLRKDPERLRTLLTEEVGTHGLQLPVVLWSRLFFDLEPYLTERRTEGGNLLSFYHRELADVGAERFLTDDVKEEFHRRLADFFHSKADPERELRWDGEGVRGLSELPFHLTNAGRWEEVYQTLTDFTFLEQKAARVGIMERTTSEGEKETLYTGVFQLQDDFDRVLQVMPGGEGRKGAKHPLIVTAVDFGEGLVVRCPWCNTKHPLNRDWLGEEISCPNDGCGGPLKVNTFTVGDLP